MNEQQNVEIVKSLYAAFHEGNIKHVIDSVHENVVWHTPGPDIVPYSGTVNGKDGVTKFFQALAETQTDMKLTADEFVAQGDRVVMRGRYEATVRQTGKRFDASWCISLPSRMEW